jgi:hypothetical protein
LRLHLFRVALDGASIRPPEFVMEALARKAATDLHLSSPAEGLLRSYRFAAYFTPGNPSKSAS